MFQIPIRVSASLRSDGGALCPNEAVATATGWLCVEMFVFLTMFVCFVGT